MTQIDEIESIKIEFDAAALAVCEFATMLRRKMIEQGGTLWEHNIVLLAQGYVKEIDDMKAKAIAYAKSDVPEPRLRLVVNHVR